MFRFVLVICLVQLVLCVSRPQEQSVFDAREELVYNKKVKEILSIEYGQLFLEMGMYGSDDIIELIALSIEDRENQLKENLANYQKKQARYLKLQQQVKAEIIQLQDNIGMAKNTQEGSLQQENNIVNQQIEHLKDLISQNYQQIDAREIRRSQLQNQVVDKLGGYTEMVNAIDQMIEYIGTIAEDETKKGMQFLQRKGQLKTLVENTQKTQVKKVKADLPMVVQLINMGFKNNYEDPNLRRQITDMLNKLRNSVQDDINVLGGEQAKEIERLTSEINNLTQEIEQWRSKVNDNSEALTVNQDTNEEVSLNIEQWEISLQRFQNESQLLKEQQNDEIAFFEKQQQDLQEELEIFKKLKGYFNDNKLLKFIQK